MDNPDPEDEVDDVEEATEEVSCLGSRSNWIVMAAGLIAIAAFGIRTIAHGDFWMHLAVGREIIRSGIPKVDLFSFALDQSIPWVNLSWLYDVVLYAMWNAGGATLITTMHVFAALAGFAASLRLLGRRGGTASVGIALLMAAYLFAPQFVVRPGVLALAFLGATMWLGTSRRSTKQRGIALVILQVVWTNLDVSALFGPFLIALLCLEQQLRPDDELRGSRPWWMAIAMLAATFVNPYGFHWHTTVLQSLYDPAFNLTAEWISNFSMYFPSPLVRAFPTITLVLIAAGFVLCRGRLPIAVTTLAVLAAFLLVRSPRFADIAALLVLPFLVLSLESIAAWLTERAPSLRNWEAPLTIGALAGALSLTGLLLVQNHYFRQTGSASSFGLGINEDVLPDGAVENAVNLPDFPKRVLNLATDGGYLLWKRPDRSIFTDTRSGRYSAELMAGFHKALIGEGNHRPAFTEKWQPDAILLNCGWPGAGSAIASISGTREWSLVYFDGTSAVLARNVGANAQLIQNRALQDAGLAKLEAARRDYRDALDHGEKPGNPARLIGAGHVFQSLGLFAEAEKMYRLLVRGTPTMDAAWLNLGICQILSGQTDQSRLTLRYVTKRMPKNLLAWLWYSKACADTGDTAEAGRARNKAARINAAVTEAFFVQVQTNRPPAIP